MIPKTWDDTAMANLEVPLAHAPASPKHVSSNYYYRLPVRVIYKSYPVYHPTKEPAGYLDWLRRQEPQVFWDDQGKRPKLETEADWIAAGELVFDWPLLPGNGRIAISMSSNLFVREARWYEKTGAPLAREGVLPFYRYLIREQGNVELGTLSCASCHTRVLSDGAAHKGAQGNFPFSRAFAHDLRDEGSDLAGNRLLERSLYAAPWVPNDRYARWNELSLDELAAPHAVTPPGVMARHRASPLSPVLVPDLFNLKNRRYLDASGLQRHRGIADLMRYAALNQGGDDLSRFVEFMPMEAFLNGKLPDDPRTAPKGSGLDRHSDEQLYALALYVYSLKPPPNPNQPKTAEQKALVKRGEAVFDSEDCARCHKPPLYTNNKLTPARGFKIPDNHPEGTNIMSRSVGTDPTLATTTRRGTGFYKVPSLLGVWYRGPFEHNGSCATLEDWFNPSRTNDTYVPTGWKGPPGTRTRAVKGHQFGLDLPEEDRKALIAFLRTL